MDSDSTVLEGVAIIGLSGRFPGANNVQQFWDNLVQQRDCISRFNSAELEFSVLNSAANGTNRRTVAARGIIDQVEQFDAEFFGIYPKEAQIMDPQHRIFLECAWESLEVAGYNPFEFAGMIGVFASSSLNTYLLHNLASDGRFAGKLAGNYQVAEYQAMLGNDKDFMPTRVSYKLNLRGPSMSIQTACSSSLVAISQACNSLLNYGCDMALAGGVSITFPQRRDYFYEEEGLASSDGVCRTFDAAANGTVFGHGCGVLLLKRLSEAVADGDNILAVIKGTAINNDGFEKIGYAAPSVNAQAEVIAMAQAAANVSPDSISYIEAHGTGTPLGDPIEIAALTKAFRDGGADGRGFCAIGSGKPNISHLDVASGAVGLIKTVMQLQYGLIPPLLHFTKPNPNIDFANSPFYPVTQAQPWTRSDLPRRAGISAFGVGGTNAHVVLEEAPLVNSSMVDGPYLLPLSARNEAALASMRNNLADRLENDESINLADVAYTLQVGRKEFSQRTAVVGTDRRQLIDSLRNTAASVKCGADSDPAVVFMFPGQGAQFVDMGLELYQREPAFRQAVDRCATILKQHLDLDIRSVIYPQSEADRIQAESRINETSITQPAIFAIEYAMAQLWLSWGIKPKAVIGHSIGEYVCAVLAGTFSLEDALSLLSVRAKLMHALPSGSMLGVRLSVQEILPLLPEGLSIAADNSAKLCTISGPTPLIESFKQTLESKKIASRTLATSHAFHSPMMDAMLEQFNAACQTTPWREPTLSWISTFTGQPITKNDLADTGYWSKQLRQTVRFAEALGILTEKYKFGVFVEVGPGQALSQFVRQHPSNVPSQNIVASFVQTEGDSNDLSQTLAALGKVWSAGVRPNWSALQRGQKRLRVALPTYPFQRTAYWVDNSQKPTTFDKADYSQLQPMCDQLATCSCDPSPNEASVSETVSTPVTIAEASNASATAISTPVATTAGNVSAVQVVPVKEKIAAELRSIILNLSGNPVTDDDMTFIDMGFDSLFLAQASQAIDSRFGVKITFRQLLGDLSTINRIASLLEVKLPADMFAEPVSSSSDPSSGPTAVATTTSQSLGAVPQPVIGSLQNSGDIQRMLEGHVQTLQRIVEASRRAPAASNSTLRTVYKPSGTSTDTSGKAAEVKRFGPYKPIEKGEKGGLTEHQQQALDRLITRYVARTGASKSYTAEHRNHFADPRAVSGFRSQWKEMVYPIVSARSKGSRIWDVDDNEYIDITMGFGTYFFGHSPDWLIAAIEKQLHIGIEIGPQSPVAGRVAKKIADFTGLDRVTFCNTGSEAVMAAMRLARTVTGRHRIVYFSGDYHGMFEEVLVRGAWPNGQYRAQPIAPGMPPTLVENILVLEYGSPESLEIIKEHADEIAAVMIEPVQSRNPGFQPRQFMHDVRRLTEEIGAALIFDEVVTGFRCHQGGAQAYFGVQADMATYGKVVGGGMPIGILAGSRKYMDALDGGAWQYGDDSFPEVGMTFFAGTFVRHPLAIAAADAVLDYLKQAGPELQSSIFERVSKVCESVNRHMEDLQVPIRMSSFSAFAAIDYASDLKFASLLWYYMREKGIHIWEGRPCYFTTAHTQADLLRFVEVFRESVEQMQADGFLPQRSDSPIVLNVPTAANPSSASELEHSDRFPLAEGQREMWLGAQMSPEAAGPHHACNAFVFEGELDVGALRRSLQMVVARHEGLRCTFSEDGSEVIVRPELTMEMPLVDLSALDLQSQKRRVDEIMLAESQRIFDLTTGPLIATQLLKLSHQKHQLVVTAQMIACDGWSHYVLFEELSEIYSSLREGRQPVLRPVVPMRRYALWQSEYAQTQAAKDCEQFWLSRFQSVPAPLDLPTTGLRPLTRTIRADRRDLLLSGAFYDQIKRYGRSQKSSSFAVLLTAFQVWLHQLSGARDIVVGVPFSEQSSLGFETLVGQCANTLPIRAQLEPKQTFGDLLGKTWEALLDAQENTHLTFGRLIQKLEIPTDPSRIPLVSVIFNIDPAMTKVKFSGLKHRFFAGPRVYFQFDLGFNLVEEEDGLRLECDFNTQLFQAEIVQQWLDGFEALLRQITTDGANSTSSASQTICSLSMIAHPELAMLSGNSATVQDAGSANESIKAVAAWTGSPNATAISAGDNSLTYTQLGMQIDRLIRAIASRTDKNATIAVIAERSIEAACGLLASMKLNATVIPISFESDDQQALVDALQRHNPSLIMFDAAAVQSGCKDFIKQKLPALSSQIVSIAQLLSESQSANVSHPDILQFEQSQARLLLAPSLSASSAVAVEVPVSVLIKRVAYAQRGFSLGNADRVAWSSHFSTIESISELLLSIVAGSQLSTLDRTVAEKSISFSNWLTQHDITWLNTTPTQVRRLLASGWLGDSRLQLVIGQEPFAHELVGKIQNVCRRAWFAFGATETSGWVSLTQLRLAAEAAMEQVADETAMAVVDQDEKPVPTGVVGKLLIRGDHLSNGYINSSELNIKRFDPCKSSSTGQPGKKSTLLTNLSARRLANGSIQVLGEDSSRIMLQTREVDLRVLEDILRQHSNLADAGVVLRDDLGKFPRIVAYVNSSPRILSNQTQPANDAEVTKGLIRALKEFLRSKLPSAWMPSQFVTLSEMPIDSVGRLDRVQLPAPALMSESDDDSDRPTSETQKKLLSIWQSILKLQKIGVHDNFFQLGGQSLQAVKVFAQIEADFGRKLPLATLFQSPTIDQLSEILDGKTSSSNLAWSSLIPIQTMGSAKPLFLVHGAGGNVLLYHALSKRLAPDFPLYGLQSQGLDGHSTALHTIEEMATHYLKEIRAVQPTGPYYLGGYCLGGTVAYEMAQQLLQAGEQVALVAMLDTYNFSRALKSSMIGFLWQKLKFHIGNIIGLRPRHLIDYFKEKFRVARDGEFANLFTSRPGYDVEAGRATAGVELKIQTINDNAAETYLPKPYAGKLTLLKPHINYKFYPDPKMGWEDLALGGLDIVEFPFNPHAMLTEPYVEQLANALVDRIDSDKNERSVIGASLTSSARELASIETELSPVSEPCGTLTRRAVDNSPVAKNAPISSSDSPKSKSKLERAGR